MMPGLENVVLNGTTLALVMRAGFSQPGITFITSPEYSQQVGYMRHPAGHRIPAHVHKPIARIVHNTREVLWVKRGRIRADFYFEPVYRRMHPFYVESLILTTGDLLLLICGGHGFTMLEESELIEVKQGPYLACDDKTPIDPVAETGVLIRV